MKTNNIHQVLITDRCGLSATPFVRSCLLKMEAAFICHESAAFIFRLLIWHEFLHSVIALGCILHLVPLVDGDGRQHVVEYLVQVKPQRASTISVEGQDGA
jgi:hypothetical protein